MMMTPTLDQKRTDEPTERIPTDNKTCKQWQQQQKPQMVNPSMVGKKERISTKNIKNNKNRIRK